MHQKPGNTAIYFIILLSSALAVIFVFTDLQISLALVNESSGWANFLERFGELPGILVLYIGTHIFLTRYRSDSKLQMIIVTMFLLIAVTFLSGYLTIVLYQGITDEYFFFQDNKILIIGVFAVLNLFVWILLRRIEFPDTLLKFAKISMLLGLYGYLLIVQPLKHLWGRFRFRDLDVIYTNFTPWFIPNGINGNQSFPSGHSAMAWMLLPLLILVIDKSKSVKSIFLSIIIIWGLVVGTSRIVIGAHYASDVLFGGLIIIFVFLLIYKNYIIPQAKEK